MLLLTKDKNAQHDPTVKGGIEEAKSGGLPK